MDLYNLDQKLAFFDSLLQNSVGVNLWIFRPNMELEYSSSDNAQLFINIMQLSNGYPDFLAYLNSGERLPLILYTDLSLTWIAIPFHIHEQLTKVYMIGPVFKTFISESSFRQYMQSNQMSLRSQLNLYRIINSTPVLDPNSEFGNLGCMLFYILHGERVKVSVLKRLSVAIEEKSISPSEAEYYHNSEFFENLLLHNVEHGHLDLETLYSNHYTYGVSGRMAPGNPIRQKKNELIALITLVSRAAIRGGYPYELALTLSDDYLQQIEYAKSENELEQLMNTLYNDFVAKVREVQQKPQYSKAISELMTILDSSVTKDFSIENATTRLGYSKYYLTQQFKKETGISVNDYLRNQRIEYAKILLSTTNTDISEISRSLHFVSSSYFAKNFKLLVGVSPSEYRNSNNSLKNEENL